MEQVIFHKLRKKLFCFKEKIEKINSDQLSKFLPQIIIPYPALSNRFLVYCEYAAGDVYCQVKLFCNII